jgi:acetyl esterase/lipase
MDAETMLDAEIAAGLAVLPIGSIDFGTWTLETVPAMREAMSAMPAPPEPPPTIERRDVVVPDPAGTWDPTVRIYRPRDAAGPLPCVYWIHGGGYMFGSALADDPRLSRWAEELPCVVVSIEYRLAPEHPYPAPLDDCYVGLVWTFEHAEELGIDPSRVAIGGASAGAGLAAGLALLARDRGEVHIAYQLLIYPMIDDRNVSASSRIKKAPIWSREANLLGWHAYLGHEPGGDDVPAYAAPARATDLSGLPPTFIGVGTLDVFRDEDIHYALGLLVAAVPTELHVYPGAPHGFELMVPTAAVAQQCGRDIDDALSRALRPR